MIIIVRSNSIKSDPRTEKYIKFLLSKNIRYFVLGWDRLGENLVNPYTRYFQRRALYNQGGRIAVFNRISWMWFVFGYLVKNRKEISIIHACDLDSAFPATLFKFIFGRKVKVIFDVFDWYTATLHKQNKLILLIFKFMEFFSIKNSDEVIVCEPERIKQIPFKLNKQALVFPNIPFFKKLDFLFENEEYKFDDEKVVFSYVGGFADERFLDELLEIADAGKINLLIAGYGEDKIEKKCREITKKNVKFFGKVNYEVGLNIMQNSDIIYAMYCKSNPNHLFAAPNKYYECMLLGKPILSTKGISIAEKIIRYDIGYVIDESISELNALVQELKKNEMYYKGKKANILWSTKYKDYSECFLTDIYYNILA
jgi:glycosyltransferase involved in cell wall biosynthesis